MDYDEEGRKIEPHDTRPEHYYGDHVRRLFLTAGAIMVLSYPFFKTLIDIPIGIALLFVLIVGLFAGLQAPQYRWSTWLNTGIAAVGFCIFTYKASSFYLTDQYVDHSIFFWTNQLLALMFFFGVYFGVKSARSIATPPKQ